MGESPELLQPGRGAVQNRRMKRALIPLMALVCAATALPAASASVAPTEGRNVSSATAPLPRQGDMETLRELPNCPTGAKANQLLTRFPLNAGDHGGITPLGNLMPTSHTLPTTHIYVSIAGTTYLPAIPGQPPEVASGRDGNAGRDAPTKRIRLIIRQIPSRQ